MSQFIYFLPGGKKSQSKDEDRAQLDAFGLAHVHDRQPIMVIPGPGPDAKGGKVDGVLVRHDTAAAQSETNRVPIYKPDQQTWLPIGDKGAMVGIWNANPPAPEHLKRKRFIRGVDVEMLDGKAWTVPVAVSMTGTGTLPKRMQLGPDGKSWLTANLPEFLGLCRDAETVFDMLRQSLVDSKLTFEFDYGMEIVVKALSVNYRVSAAELSLLGCVGDQTMALVMRALCDWDAFIEALVEQGKNESASAPPDTASGAEADSPAISQPSAT